MPDKQQHSNPRKPKNLNDYARYSGMAFQMGITIAGGTFGGIKLDEWLNSGFPVFTIVLSLLSVIAAMYLVLKDFTKTKND